MIFSGNSNPAAKITRRTAGDIETTAERKTELAVLIELGRGRQVASEIDKLHFVALRRVQDHTFGKFNPHHSPWIAPQARRSADGKTAEIDERAIELSMACIRVYRRHSARFTANRKAIETQPALDIDGQRPFGSGFGKDRFAGPAKDTLRLQTCGARQAKRKQPWPLAASKVNTVSHRVIIAYQPSTFR